MSEIDSQKYESALLRFADATLFMQINPVETMALIGAMQLAMRHPAFPETTRIICMNFIRECQKQLEPLEPVLCEAIERGFNTDFDKL